MDSDLLSLHEDYCVNSGFIAEFLCKRLEKNLDDLNIRFFLSPNTIPCPFSDCGYIGTFSDLLVHIEESHDIPGLQGII